MNYLSSFLTIYSAVFFGMAVSPTAAQGDNTPTCPDYYQFDTLNPTTTYYGDAPEGCVCREGMQDLNCAFCTDNAPCQAVNENHVCRTDILYAERDTYKAYDCRLHGSLNTFVPNARVSVYADVTTGKVDLSVYRGSINNTHVMDCEISGCVFPVGGSDIGCDQMCKL